MSLFHYFCNPLEELIEGVVAAVRTVPGQKEVDILTCILQFCGEVDGNGEGCVTVACPMTDIPVRGNRGLAIANEAHGIHQSNVLTDVIGENRAILLSGIVGKVYAVACLIAELLILAAGIVDALYLAVEGRNTL